MNLQLFENSSINPRRAGCVDCGLRDQCIQIVQLCENIQQHKAMETPAEKPADGKK